MHPSKTHQSTTAEPDSGLRLGFTDIEAKGKNQPSGITQQTPTKVGIGSGAFDFRFARPAPQLGPEAQRMMDELRGEALKIKAKLAAERELEIQREEIEEASMGGRKIAKPKGKAGRFSDAHIQEFKRMDSIAGHPSAFRAQPDRITSTIPQSLKRTQSKANLYDREDPRVEQNTQSGRVTPAKILKRKQSKATLDEKEDIQLEQNTQTNRGTAVNQTLKRTQSKAKLIERGSIQPERSTQIPTPRLENTAPAKRARQTIADDVSTGRPISRDGHQATRARRIVADDISTGRPISRDGQQAPRPTPSTPSTIPRSHSNLQSLSTPTQASLARSAQTKLTATQIPGLSRSPSKPKLTETPRTLPKSQTSGNLSSLPRSESKGFLRSPGKLDRVKSILRHTSFSSKKPSSIPSLTRSPSRPNLDKALPSTPNGSEKPTIKHVNFTPETVNKNAANVHNSPSPAKQSGLPRTISRINFNAKQHGIQAEGEEIKYPTLSFQPSAVEYPTLSTPRALPMPPRKILSEIRPPASVPGTFTFRSDHTINFEASPKGFGSSPGQASVRQVRQSILPQPTISQLVMPQSIPGAFPVCNKENALPSVPHGLSSKKRRRVSDDDDDEGGLDEREFKKQKPNHTPEGAMLFAPRIMGERIKVEKRKLASAGPSQRVQSPAKKQGLSLSRLNLLARPKMRR